jgi:hypothetical protein
MEERRFSAASSVIADAGFSPGSRFAEKKQSATDQCPEILRTLRQRRYYEAQTE